MTNKTVELDAYSDNGICVLRALLWLERNMLDIIQNWHFENNTDLPYFLQ